MQQVLFHLPDWLPWVGGVPVYGYGVMLVLGFFASLQLGKFLGRRSGIDPEVFVNAGLIALVTGVIGARLSHVLENLEVYTDSSRSAWENLKAAANIRSGGLTFYGGFLLATPCTIAYGLIRRVPIRLGMDIVAPCVMVGLAFGRIGCLLNGCCYGAECHLPPPLSVQFPYHSNPYTDQFRNGTLKELPPPEAVHVVRGEPVPMSTEDIARNPTLSPERRSEVLAEVRSLDSNPLHPAQLYSTITALLVAAVLVACFTLPHVPGRVFALMLMIEAPSRFVLEMLRSEPPFVGPDSDPLRLTFLPNMSFSMVLSVGLLLAGVVLWFVFGRMGGRVGGGEEAQPAGSAARAATA